MKYFIQTFGCQMNKLDSELVRDILEAEGHEWADDSKEASLVIFNTCSVRDHAENKFFSYLGKLKAAKKKRPGMVVGVIGCAAQRLGEDIIRRMPHVDFVLGTGRLGLIGRMVKGALDERCVTGFDAEDSIVKARAGRKGGIKAFVSVMRGCDCRCSYCVVPSARGAEASRKPDEILQEVRELEGLGVREVTLLGQSVDRYGRGLAEEIDLAELLKMICEGTDLIRLRFVTSNPAGVTPRLLETMAEIPEVCESLHIPVQSGSDRILKAMRRPYTSAQYVATVKDARKYMPNIELSSDFIIGFPGETDDDYEETVRLLEDVGFLQGFIFKYSPRTGTRAADMPDDVSENTKSVRHSRLLGLQNDASLSKHRELIGRSVEVLVEGPSKNDPAKSVGRTRQNHIVIFEPGRTAPGQLANVRIETCTALSLYGEAVS